MSSPLPTSIPLILIDVVVRAELHVVADADRGTTRPSSSAICRRIIADAVEQVAALIGVDERDQAVSDLELHRVEIEQARDLLRLLGFLRLQFGSLPFGARPFARRSCRTEKYA